MKPRLLAALIATAAAFGVTARAENPADPEPPYYRAAPVDPQAQQEQAVARQIGLYTHFQAFEDTLLRLRERLKTSLKDEDRAAVQRVDAVLKEIKDQALERRFERIMNAVQDPDVFKKIQGAGEVEVRSKELRRAVHQVAGRLNDCRLQTDLDPVRGVVSQSELMRALGEIEAGLGEQEEGAASTKLTIEDVFFDDSLPRKK